MVNNLINGSSKVSLFFLIALLLALTAYGILFLFSTSSESSSFNSFFETQTAAVIKEEPAEEQSLVNQQKQNNQPIIPVVDKGSITSVMCQVADCVHQITRLFKSANNSILCAFYDFDNQQVFDALLSATQRNVFVQIIVDGDNKQNLAGNAFQFDTSTAYMHNKFCIVDEQLLFTGSANPTDNDLFNNDNNIVIINSSLLAKNYHAEFEELATGTFGKGKQVQYPVVSLILDQDRIGNILIENYFCPEDDCEQKVLQTLVQANVSIDFMLFSFTSNAIGELLLEKASQGIAIQGILDKSQNQNSKYSQFEKLQNAGRNTNSSVALKKNKYKLHHKVFIIDKKIVITGSYNPTQNGNENNDENILIIHDERIAQQYFEEVKRIKESISKP